MMISSIRDPQAVVTATEFSLQAFMKETCTLQMAEQFWKNFLKNYSHEELIFEECRITNVNALPALFDNLPPNLKKIDFANCTFCEEAFLSLLNTPDKRNCELIFSFLPLELTSLITPEALKGITTLTILPQRKKVIEEVEVFLSIITALNNSPHQTIINLSKWNLSEAQRKALRPSHPQAAESAEILPSINLSEAQRQALRPSHPQAAESAEILSGIDLSDAQRQALSPSQTQAAESAEIPPSFELFQNKSWTKKECEERWTQILSHYRGEEGFPLNNVEDCYVAVENPLHIHSFFSVCRAQGLSFKTLDFTAILFSDSAFLALAQNLKVAANATLCLDIFTAGQLETFFKETPQSELDKVIILDIPRRLILRTTTDEKKRLNEVLTAHLHKLKNLQELFLTHWFLEDSHLGFIKHLPEGAALSMSERNNADEMLNTLTNKEFDHETLKVVWLELFGSNSVYSIKFGDVEKSVVADSPVSIQALFEVLKESPQITEIEFTGIEFSDEAWEELLKRLSSCENIDSLKLMRCHLSPARISSLRRLTHLQHLALMYNAELVERRAFCEAISGLLRSLPLMTICLDRNLITDEESKELLPDNLQKNTWVSLQSNCLSLAGCTYLKEKYKRAEIEWEMGFNPVPESTSPEFDRFRQLLSQPLPLTEKYQTYQLKAPNEKYFHALLESLFQVINVKADGNCLFHACCHLSKYTHGQLRELSVDCIEKNPELSAHIDTNVTKYLTDMRKLGSWGGDVEIAALGRVLDCPIAVFSKEYNYEVQNDKLYPVFNVYNFDGNGDIYLNPKTIFLYRSHERHFLRLIPNLL